MSEAILKRPKIDIFLDSGAFSAFTKGVEIDIYKYIDFIKANMDRIHIYANLDVIGTDKKSAKLTYKNQGIMEEAGLNPIPVFHLHEPFKYLKLYVEKYDYIALGIAGRTQHKILIPWMDQCFTDYICDAKKFPKVKVHGFAVTSLKLMLRYPWYSVDSISWVMTSRMGAIYLPEIKENGDWVYDADSWKIMVSARSPSLKNPGRHIDTVPPEQRKSILDYIHRKGFRLGKSELKKVSAAYDLKENERWCSPEESDGKRMVEVLVEPGICNIYQQRDEMNVIFFKDLEAALPEWPWPFLKEKPTLPGF